MNNVKNDAITAWESQYKSPEPVIMNDFPIQLKPKMLLDYYGPKLEETLETNGNPLIHPLIKRSCKLILTNLSSPMILLIFMRCRTRESQFPMLPKVARDYLAVPNLT